MTKFKIALLKDVAKIVKIPNDGRNGYMGVTDICVSKFSVIGSSSNCDLQLPNLNFKIRIAKYREVQLYDSYTKTWSRHRLYGYELQVARIPVKTVAQVMKMLVIWRYMGSIPQTVYTFLCEDISYIMGTPIPNLH